MTPSQLDFSNIILNRTGIGVLGLSEAFSGVWDINGYIGQQGLWVQYIDSMWHLGSMCSIASSKYFIISTGHPLSIVEIGCYVAFIVGRKAESERLKLCPSIMEG